MTGLEKLARDHAYWADRVRTLKRLGEESTIGCARIAEDYQDNCIGATYEEWRNSDTNEYGKYEASFEAFWEEDISEGRVCAACQDVRRYKAERMQARKRLGAVRAAITRVGRRLQLSSPDCEACGGIGEIDETLGGEPTSDPRAPCPDCQKEEP